MAKAQGHTTPQFSALSDLLQSYLDSDTELGCSIAVNLHGEDVVDIWGGFTNESKTQPWQRNTIVPVWSSTKNVTSLAALIAMDRGLLSPEQKVATIWPEFATNGKQDVEVRMLMSHTSGLPGWEVPVSRSDVYDVQKSTRLLAEQAPWYTPGSASAYHAITHGQLVGELVRRSIGKSLTQFVAEEVAGPLGADFQIGCLESDWDRVATIIPPNTSEAPVPDISPDSIAFKVIFNPPPDAEIANTADYRQAEMGGSNGHSNARGLNRILSAVTLGGERDGVRLLQKETVEKIFEQQAFGTDLVLGVPIRFGLGYGLTGKDTVMSWLPEGRVCHWIGWGGSMTVMDLDRGLTVSYVMNRMGAEGLWNLRTKEFVLAAYRAIGFEP